MTTTKPDTAISESDSTRLARARREIAELKQRNRHLESELGRDCLPSRLFGPCVAILMITATFSGSSAAIARGLDALNIQLPSIRVELPQRGDR